MKTFLILVSTICFSLSGMSQRFTYPTSGSAAAALVAPDGVTMQASLSSVGCVPGTSSTFVYSTSHVSSSAIYRNTRWAAGCKNSTDIIKLDFTSVDIRPLGMKFSIYDVDNGADSVSVQIFSGGVPVSYSYQLYSPTYVTASGTATSTGFYGSANNNSVQDDNTGRVDIATVDPMVSIDSIIIYKHNNIDGSGNPSQSFAGFDWSASAALPVKLLSFTVKQRGKELYADWTVAHEGDAGAFQVEYSPDQRNFFPLGSPVAARSTQAGEHKYSLTAPAPSHVSQFWVRLASIDSDGKKWFSQTVRMHQQQQPGSVVYPSLFRTAFSVAITVPQPTTCGVRLVSMEGRTVYRAAHRLTTGPSVIPVIASSLPAGVYILTGELSDGSVIRHRVIKE